MVLHESLNNFEFIYLLFVDSELFFFRGGGGHYFRKTALLIVY